MVVDQLIARTQSLCPECLRLLDAEIFESKGKVWIRKNCLKHGETLELYWGDAELFKKAQKFRKEQGKKSENPIISKENPVCPVDCGLCNLHLSHTALANIVVTNRCDLSCWYCFFFAQKMGYVYEPSTEQIKEMLKLLRTQKPVPCNAVQFTGGEPSLREDILNIIRMAKEEGFNHIQFNTNGIRMARDGAFVKALKEAGVSTVYLSFDGVSGKTNYKNHFEAPTVLANARKANLGIVLVPTIIKSVNDHEIGDILRFGLGNIEVVRAVNYQPVSLVGRMPGREREKFRITIPDTIRLIEEQTGGMLVKEDFYPVPTVTSLTKFVEAITNHPTYELSTHFACGMATYVFKEDEKVIPITRFLDVDGLTEYLDQVSEELKKQGGVSKTVEVLKTAYKLKGFIDEKNQPRGLNFLNLLKNVLTKGSYAALGEIHTKSMFVGMMHFQDLYNYDVERVKRCCIHYATPDGRIVPFCAFNVIPEWYRDAIQRKYSVSIEEWEKKTGKKLKDDLYKRKPLEASREEKDACQLMNQEMFGTP